MVDALCVRFASAPSLTIEGEYPGFPREAEHA
jgi:hypothetical protein